MLIENQKILLVEDDQNFGDVLRSYLEMNAYDVTWATDGVAGLEAYRRQRFDLCIFDVMMPKKDGFTLAHDIRKNDTETPIIFLTAKTMKEDVLKGFKIGADDYISKPFNSEELLFRILAILKRRRHRVADKDDVQEYQMGKYRFNFRLRMLVLDGSKGGDGVKLSPKEAFLLRLFCKNMNDVVPRTDALIAIWGEDNYFTARSMDVFVTKIRKYLKDDPNVELVNIHGNGFQLLVKTEESV